MLVSVELPVSSTVAVVTLRRWDKTGDLRPAWRTPGGHRRYSMDALNTMSGRSAPKRKTVGYARVSSHDQKDDLKRQADRLKGHAGTNDCAEPEIITDLGSGLNDKKRGLQRLLRMICRGEIGTLMLTHKDRLLRFGADLIFGLCTLHGVRVVVLENGPDTFEDRLTRDVIDLMTVFPAELYGAKLYGRRSHANRKTTRA
mgnify:FL=1